MPTFDLELHGERYRDACVYYEATYGEKTLTFVIDIYDCLRDYFHIVLDTNDPSGSALRGFSANREAIIELTKNKILSGDFETDQPTVLKCPPNPGTRYRVQ